MYNANYMEGVPVKIAERYKPPPAIYKLPQSLANKLNLDNNYYWNCPAFSYDLQLEQKALSKIEQWKRIRQRNKEQRMERILRMEQQRKREYEDRQKNLLYSVSYPSTDDLSSGEEEEKAENVEKCKESSIDFLESKEMAPQVCVTKTVNSFHDILQPTVLSYKNSSDNSTLAPLIKTPFEGKLSNSFNYKDFEDDTSSPFDSIELKTINDLDVLAQVLHNTQIKSLTNVKFNDNDNLVEQASCDNSKETPNKSVFMHQQDKMRQQEHNDPLITPEHIPKSNNNLPKFNYDFNSTEGALTEFNDHHPMLPPVLHYDINYSPSQVTTENQYNGSVNYSENYVHGLDDYSRNHCNIQNVNKTNAENSLRYDRLQPEADDQVAKSRSVPNILKELRDEIRNSEIRRYRNCSFNIDESTQDNICLIKETTRNNVETENSDTFSQMDSKAKQLVEQISAMGFPQKRVARIVQLVGADDKKVIEHLIPLSELVDLGFEEMKISDALIRNRNNKNKALDELIS